MSFTVSYMKLALRPNFFSYLSTMDNFQATIGNSLGNSKTLRHHVVHNMHYLLIYANDCSFLPSRVGEFFCSGFINGIQKKSICVLKASCVHIWKAQADVSYSESVARCCLMRSLQAFGTIPGQLCHSSLVRQLELSRTRTTVSGLRASIGQNHASIVHKYHQMVSSGIA